MTYQRRQCPEPNAAEARGRREYAKKLSRALELGFSERQAPFIAVAALRRPGWTVGRLKQLVGAQYPGLFDDPAQGRLFDEVPS